MKFIFWKDSGLGNALNTHQSYYLQIPPPEKFFRDFSGGDICSGSTSLYFPLEIKKYFSKSKISGGVSVGNRTD